MTSADSPQSLSLELERRTRELERSERRFLDIIEHTAEAILVVDLAGVIRFANPVAKAMFATRREELVGTYFGFPVVSGETTELDVVSGGRPRSVEMRVTDSEWEGAPARLASLRDITERKEAEEHARHLIREQARRAAAEATAKTLQFLVDASTRLSASLDYETTLRMLATLCVGEIADWAVVYAVDTGGCPRRVAVGHCDPDKVSLARELEGIPIDARGAHPVLDVLRTRTPKVIHDITDDTLAKLAASPREREIASELGIASYVLVPMVARGHAFGALSLVTAKPARRFTADDVTLAADIASRAALAIDNARLYGEAQRANQSKTDFLAVVSHDLRTPLTAIIGYADLLDAGIPVALPMECQKSVQRIRTSAKHLLYLLDELLAFARLDGGIEELRVAAHDVRDVVKDAAAMVQRLAEERGLALRLHLPDEPVEVETDADKLRQVLLNLAGNAVKYTERGGVDITVVAEPADVVSIEVRDTGKGIADEHLSQIFEPFWQVDRMQRTQGQGTGLGLSVVRRMLDLLGGTIRVESRLGAGSAFTIRLPRHARDETGMQ
ncbi:MAG: PAS domain-containing sensor histidine kinase [Gemmatimonadaceae bacterium]